MAADSTARGTVKKNGKWRTQKLSDAEKRSRSLARNANKKPNPPKKFKGEKMGAKSTQVGGGVSF